MSEPRPPRSGPLALACGVLSAACGAEPDRSAPPDGGALAAATGTVGALDRGALQAGNLALSCDEEELDRRARELLGRMTLSQKLAEMHGSSPAPVDGLYLAGGDATLGIPPLRMCDGPRGVRAGTATAFPVAMARGATFDPELERRVGLAIGRELRAKGGDVLLAPTVNLLRHPGWGRAQETYSEDPAHMSLMAAAFIGGVQNTVMASVKHFAVNSVENTRFTMTATLDERTLRDVYLPHFEIAVREARVASVMSSYNRVNGTYAAENPHLLRDVLRRDWGFRGFVESDWFLGVHSTVPSLRAGLDVEMPSANHYGPKLAAAVESGEVGEGEIDDSVLRILRQKLCFAAERAPAVDPAVVEGPEHRALAREVAERSLVLLVNRGGTLPLDAAAALRVAVVGSLAGEANLGDRGSSGVTSTDPVSPLEGLRAAAPGAAFVEVLTDDPDEAALEEIAAADVAVVVAGLTYRDEGEFIPIAQEGSGLERGGDRASLALPAAAAGVIDRVLSRARRTVVVLEGGSAVLLRPFAERVDALLLAFYPGAEGGHAIGDALFGRVNPGGKLPVTFPRDERDLPSWDITAEEVQYDYLHGYRLLDARDVTPEFPFGFGLSYTEFALARLELDRAEAAAGETITVSVDLGNVGRSRGDEVVQLYAGRESWPAPRELVAFRRVTLEPGEVTRVELELRVDDLARWDEASGARRAEPGEYRLEVGTSSRDLPLARTLRVR